VGGDGTGAGATGSTREPPLVRAPCCSHACSVAATLSSKSVTGERAMDQVEERRLGVSLLAKLELHDGQPGGMLAYRSQLVEVERPLCGRATRLQSAKKGGGAVDASAQGGANFLRIRVLGSATSLAAMNSSSGMSSTSVPFSGRATIVRRRSWDAATSFCMSMYEEAS
jgi:hypothetical protein